MTAAVGLPTLRLVRVRVGDIGLGGLAPGSTREIEEGGQDWPRFEFRDPGRSQE
jgi:16S rRNA U516 pseudouridylate synthase RsuA-like enzyme